MPYINRFVLLLGDLAVLYVSLFITLLIRYGTDMFWLRLSSHFFPFSLLFLVWLLVFLINDLYKVQSLRVKALIFRSLFTALLVSFGLSVLIFYLFGNFFALTPKTNLALFGAISLILLSGWRFSSVRLLSFGQVRVLFLGNSPSFLELIAYLERNAQVGYKVVSHIRDLSPQSLQRIHGTDAHLVVLGPSIAHISFLFSSFQLSFLSRMSFVPFQDFYGSVFEKVSLSDIDEEWIKQLLSLRRRAYDFFKRVLDFALGVLFLALFFPLILCIGFLVGLTSRGPVIFTQSRVGKGGAPFPLYKFRTMRHEEKGPLFTLPGDRRVTPLGKFLRFTHFDELPQLINIIRGDISFTGPRPERLELAETYRSLPYYDFRHIVKPGLTGWAQIHYGPSTSLEEAREKLSYDLFYVKHRSFPLDLVLLLKTLRYLFVSFKR
ncbi:MAG: sugar transferase [bacterium]|nr:sugar transferase [bacterium]